MLRALIFREIASILTSRWASVLVVGPFVLLSALVVLRWPTAGEVDVAGIRARGLFALIGNAQLCGVLLLVPAFPAASIVRERRQGTLALLFNAPIQGRTILLAKFLANVICLAVPLIMGLPAVAACYAMGGIDLVRDVLPLYVLFALVSSQLVAMALWVSCFASSPLAAIRSAYAMMTALAILTLAPAMFVPPGASSLIADAARGMRLLSPIPPAMAIVGRNPLGMTADVDSEATLGTYASLSVVLTALFLLHAAFVLKPTMLDRARPAGAITQERSVAAQRQRRLFYLIDPQRRAGAMPDWINPVMVKEFRGRRFGRGHWLVRLVAFSAVASLAMTYAATTGVIAMSPETIGGVMVFLQSALIIVLTPSLASGIISDEQEGGGWTLLRMTPLTAGQILRGKLMSVGWTVLLVLGATLPGYAIMMLIKPVLRQQVVAVLLTLLLTAAFAMCFSGAVSAFFRRTAPATIVAYLALVVILLGPLLVWLGREAPFGLPLVARMLALSPVAAALSLIDSPGFTSYRLLPAAWWITGGGIVVSLAVLLWKVRQLEKPQ
jgi:ABC-type transport system involved in multi-copper enzyme maturation permease subunit